VARGRSRRSGSGRCIEADLTDRSRAVRRAMRQAPLRRSRGPCRGSTGTFSRCTSAQAVARPTAPGEREPAVVRRGRHETVDVEAGRLKRIQAASSSRRSGKTPTPQRHGADARALADSAAHAQMTSARVGGPRGDHRGGVRAAGRRDAAYHVGGAPTRRRRCPPGGRVGDVGLRRGGALQLHRAGARPPHGRAREQTRDGVEQAAAAGGERPRSSPSGHASASVLPRPPDRAGA